MTGQGTLFARLSHLPYLLALSVSLSWHVHGQLFAAVEKWSIWREIWGPGPDWLEPRMWANWILGTIVFIGAFELFRRFDWFFQPLAAPPSPNTEDSGEEANDARSKSSEERNKAAEERRKDREKRKEERVRKKEEAKAEREKAREENLRQRAEKSAAERARKVREAADEAILEEDHELELKHGNTLGLKGKLTPSEIKKKYKQLMVRYHPDKVRSMGDEIREVAERKAKEINEAFDYFRKKYDL